MYTFNAIPEGAHSAVVFLMTLQDSRNVLTASFLPFLTNFWQKNLKKALKSSSPWAFDSCFLNLQCSSKLSYTGWPVGSPLACPQIQVSVIVLWLTFSMGFTNLSYLHLQEVRILAKGVLGWISSAAKVCDGLGIIGLKTKTWLRVAINRETRGCGERVG